MINTKYIEKGVLELIGPFGFYKFFRLLHIKINNFLPPLLFNYLFVFFFNLFILLLLLIIGLSNFFYIFVNNIGLVIIIIVIIFIMF